jgi:hypothetical protein
MNEVRKYFADAFRHMGGNRVCLRSKSAFIRTPAATHDSFAIGTSLRAALGYL